MLLIAIALFRSNLTTFLSQSQMKMQILIFFIILKTLCLYEHKAKNNSVWLFTSPKVSKSYKSVTQLIAEKMTLVVYRILVWDKNVSSILQKLINSDYHKLIFVVVKFFILVGKTSHYFTINVDTKSFHRIQQIFAWAHFILEMSMLDYQVVSPTAIIMSCWIRVTTFKAGEKCWKIKWRY